MALKGQNLRIFVGDRCIAAATSCTIHLGTTQDQTTTKDSTGDWDEIEITGKNWDVTCESLYSTDGTAVTTSQLLAMLGTQVTVKFDETDGTSNRTAKNTFSHSGSAFLVDMNISAQNRQNVTSSIQFKGSGPLN